MQKTPGVHVFLLQHIGLQKPLRSLHAHNEQQRCEALLTQLRQGESVVLVSDAGTPAVSDPGAAVVAAAHAAGFTVSPIAGPSALTAALSVCGFHDVGWMGGHVLFVGFIPQRKAAAVWAKVLAHTGIVVLFEAPHRIAATLATLAAKQPERLACVCREMTKMHEEVVRAPLAALAHRAAVQSFRGEVTLVLGPARTDVDSHTAGPWLALRAFAGQDAGVVAPSGVAAADSTQPLVAIDDAIVEACLQRCLATGLSARDAATAVAAVLQLPRRAVYTRSVALSR